MKQNTSNLFLICSSFLLGFILTIIKLPSWANELRPAFIPLILCYWCLFYPEKIGLITAWILGIILDGINNTLLGEHALSLLLPTYFVLKFHRQIRVFPIWQQAFIISVLTFLYQFTLFWVQGIIGQPTGGALFWLPAITTSLLWPIEIPILHHLLFRRKFNKNR
ncbi:MAG: Rod shape-determining protein MreD [Legionellaceae bacterium]